MRPCAAPTRSRAARAAAAAAAGEAAAAEAAIMSSSESLIFNGKPLTRGRKPPITHHRRRARVRCVRNEPTRTDLTLPQFWEFATGL